MTHYLGELGKLVPIRPRPIVDPMTVTHERPSTLNTTLGEVRVAQYGPKARAFRAWDVTIPDCTPDQLAPVLGFINGDYGVGPFWWLPEWAQQTNVLPPAVASLKQPWRNCTYGGPVTLPDGTYAPESLIASGNTWIDQAPGIVLQVPVRSGEPVTAAAWLRSNAGQTLRVDVEDATGTVIQQATGSASAGGAWRQAVATIAAVADGGHHAEVFISGPGRIAAPVVTWSSTYRRYSTGEGCATAIVTGDIDEDVHINMDDPYPWGQVASANLTVTEVG